MVGAGRREESMPCRVITAYLRHHLSVDVRDKNAQKKWLYDVTYKTKCSAVAVIADRTACSSAIG